MTQACADCCTDNRDGAKFCKGCGKRLVSPTPVRPAAVTGSDEEWPATQRMPMHSNLPSPPGPSPRRPAPAPAAASRRRVEPAERKSAPRSTTAERPSPWRSAVIGLLIVAGPVAIAAWFFSEPPRPAISPAPALAANSPTPTAPVPVEPAAPLATPPQDEPSAPDPAPAPAPAPVSAPVSALAPMPAMPSALPEPALARPAAPMKPVPAPPKSRKPAQPPAPVAALPAPAPAEPAPPPPPAAPPSPQLQCAGLNFFARAQCLAAQCAKPELKSNAQCEAVRRQQQIEEERRNPTLLN